MRINEKHYCMLLILIGPPDSFVDRSIWEKILLRIPLCARRRKTPQQVWDQVSKEYVAKDLSKPGDTMKRLRVNWQEIKNSVN